MEVSILRDVDLLCLGRSPTSGTCDQRYVVAGDNKNTRSVRMWSGFKSRPGGLLSSMAERAQCFAVCERARLGQCASESCACSTSKLRSRHRMHDAVQTPSASIWLAASNNRSRSSTMRCKRLRLA